MFKFVNRSGSSRNRFFSVAESLLIVASVYFSAISRFQLDTSRIPPFELLLPKALVIMAVFQLALYYHDLNFGNMARFRGKLALRLLQALAVASVGLFVIYYLYPSAAVGRGILSIAMLLLFLGAWLLRRAYVLGSKANDFGERAVILGTGRLARRIAQTIRRQPALGYKIVGCLDQDPARAGMAVGHSRIVGVCEDLLAVVRERKVQTIISALSEQRGSLPVHDLLECKLNGIKVVDGISLYEQLLGRITLDELKPSWVIFSIDFQPSRNTLVVKRFLEVVFSILGILLAAPLFVLIPVLIKLDSLGPVFYLQERAGAQGAVFTLFKFRSMRWDAESASGPVWAKKGDDRITRVGRWLRTMRLDELPQLINILRGDMSLVGPRPERPNFVERLAKQNPYYVLRLSVKPGLTGWAQVNYRYGATEKEALEKLQYDLYYIKHLSVMFDLYIIFDTIKTVIRGRGAR